MLVFLGSFASSTLSYSSNTK